MGFHFTCLSDLLCNNKSTSYVEAHIFVMLQVAFFPVMRLTNQ